MNMNIHFWQGRVITQTVKTDSMVDYVLIMLIDMTVWSIYHHPKDF